MRKNIKRTICLLLSLTMVFSTALFAFAVDYPVGVTKEMCEESAVKTDKLVANAAYALTGKSLRDTVKVELCKDETLSSLLTGIYSSLAESESTLSKLGIDTSPKGLALHLGAYPSVAKSLEKAADWGSVDLSRAKWNVASTGAFCDAVGAVFSPFNDILYALLCSGKYKAGVIKIKGDDGYENGIMSLLSALGCTEITSAADFKSEAAADKNKMMSLICASLLSSVFEITDAPAQRLCDILPGLADYIKNGGLEETVNAVLKPLTLHIGSYIQLFTGSQMISFLMFVQDPDKYTMDFSENITVTMNEMLESTDITLPEIDLDAMIACKNDRGGAYRLLVAWLIDAAKLNSDKLEEMLPDDENTAQIAELAKGLLQKDTDELFTMLVSLFTSKEGKTLDYQWAAHEYTKGQAQYTENLGEREIGRVLDGIDDTISEFIVEMAGGEPLTDTVKSLVYSNSLITTLVKGLYGALSGEETKVIAQALSLPTKPYQLSAQLKEGSFYYTRSTLSRYSSWDKIENVNWGFRDGNKNGFRNALVAVLRPMIPILEAFLANGTVEIFESVNIGGGNGYNTAVIPLLEALGCSSKKIKTYDKYIKGKGTDKILTDIIDPVLDLVDKVAKRPIYTATAIIPNILFFIDNGSLAQCIDNLIYPLTSLMEELSVDISSLGVDLEEIKNIDILSKVTESASSLAEGIDIGTPDLKKLIGMGELTHIKSKRTYNGERVTAEYVKADQKAVLMTILRYVVGLLGKEENSGLMDSFMGGGEAGGSGGMFDQYSAGIGEQMAEMTPEETLEWLYKLFFRERPVAETTGEEYIPTIIYVQQSKKKPGKLPIVISVMLLIAVGAFAFVRRDSISDWFKYKKERKNDKKQKKGNKEG